MESDDPAPHRASKRPRIGSIEAQRHGSVEVEGGRGGVSEAEHKKALHLPSIERPISPPSLTSSKRPDLCRIAQQSQPEVATTKQNNGSAEETILHSSPFQLSQIRDLPRECNVDTVTLQELLGEPLIKEAWLFDYLFDIDFVM